MSARPEGQGSYRSGKTGKVREFYVVRESQGKVREKYFFGKVREKSGKMTFQIFSVSLEVKFEYNCMH